MKADGKYRFNLQFPAETEEQIKVGELLERVGNKKSAVVIDAVYTYLQAHPELLNVETKIEIRSTPNKYDRVEIEQMIRNVVKEYFATEQNGGHCSEVVLADDMDDDISQMLDNLELFQ